jgi:hypothetical protein
MVKKESACMALLSRGVEREADVHQVIVQNPSSSQHGLEVRPNVVRHRCPDWQDAGLIVHGPPSFNFPGAVHVAHVVDDVSREKATMTSN